MVALCQPAEKPYAAGKERQRGWDGHRGKATDDRDIVVAVDRPPIVIPADEKPLAGNRRDSVAREA